VVASDAVADASESVALPPLTVPFSFVRVVTGSEIRLVLVEAATVAPVAPASFTARQSTAECVELIEINAVYERFVDTVELRYGSDAGVVREAGVTLPAVFAPDDGGYVPDLPMSVTARSTRWAGPWATSIRIPPDLSLTVPAEPRTRWNRYEPFTLQWDPATAPSDATVELEFTRYRGANTDLHRLRCSAPASRGTLTVRLDDHPAWFRDALSGVVQGYEVYVVRRRIERAPAGELVAVEGSVQIQYARLQFE
jgi:hypothetical protein